MEDVIDSKHNTVLTFIVVKEHDTQCDSVTQSAPGPESLLWIIFIIINFLLERLRKRSNV